MRYGLSLFHHQWVLHVLLRLPLAFVLSMFWLKSTGRLDVGRGMGGVYLTGGGT